MKAISNKQKTTRFLRKKEILEIIGVSNVTLWRWIDKGAFPKSYELGENSVGWKDNEVNEWIENRLTIKKGFGNRWE